MTYSNTERTTKQIDEQKEMISKQAHLVVQRIQEEQHLKSSLKEKDKEIDSLHDIVINLEVRLEHQEQYSRRTSLRFHNIDVLVDDRGHIIHPVNTDDIIVDICKNKLVFCDEDSVGIIFEISFGVIHFFATSV
jgi:hypothetical protein